MKLFDLVYFESYRSISGRNAGVERLESFVGILGLVKSRLLEVVKIDL